jgi:thiol:disulfide interchange protein DsbD
VTDQTSTAIPDACSIAQPPHITDYISSLFNAASSLPMRAALALVLGLLLSLTPCIYPMIPITVGILQAGSSTSIVRNFARAGAYASGMAITFACLGLISAFTGNLFGSAMSSPWVICFIVLLLIYVAGSMIGWYDMYIPRFLQQSSTPTRGGSLLSAFSFGAASGTVASPCLSPGLLLLISFIAQEGNIAAGFLILFAFGIGLSIPLLLIGTFSSSLSMLPRAGMWMVEVKRLLGFLMLFMCLYFLKPLVPYHIVLWLAVVLLFCIGVYYQSRYIWQQKTIKRSWKYILAMAIYGGILYVAVHTAYKAFTEKPTTIDDTFWLHRFDHAHTQALAEHKKLLIDVTAPYCTICTAIENKFFCNAKVREYYLEQCVPVKINGADTHNEMHMHILQTFKIIGVPTLILLDPVTNTELKRWGAELYDYSVEEFLHELET